LAVELLSLGVARSRSPFSMPGARGLRTLPVSPKPYLSLFLRRDFLIFWDVFLFPLISRFLTSPLAGPRQTLFYMIAGPPVFEGSCPFLHGKFIAS